MCALLSPAAAQCPYANTSSSSANWIDPTNHTHLSISSLDDAEAALHLPFNLTYFCQLYSTVYVNTNGFVSFRSFSGSGILSENESPIPPLITAVLWDDWSPNKNGDIYESTLGASPDRILVVSWVDLQHFNGNSPSPGPADRYAGWHNLAQTCRPSVPHVL